MKWIVELDEECNELYITQDEIDNAVHSSMGIVGDFMRQYPLTKIDTVKIVTKCKDDDMPCFGCEAFFDDELCYKKRHEIDENGIELEECPRIGRMPKNLEGGEQMKKTIVDILKEVGEEADMNEYRESEGDKQFEEMYTLKGRVVELEDLTIELKSICRYLRAEVASNRAMLLKLAEIVDSKK